MTVLREADEMGFKQRSAWPPWQWHASCESSMSAYRRTEHFERVEYATGQGSEAAGSDGRWRPARRAGKSARPARLAWIRRLATTASARPAARTRTSRAGAQAPAIQRGKQSPARKRRAALAFRRSEFVTRARAQVRAFLSWPPSENQLNQSIVHAVRYWL